MRSNKTNSHYYQNIYIHLFVLTLTLIAGLYCLYHPQVYASEKPPSNKPKVTIGILMPMDHIALREIVSGFKNKVTEHYGSDVTFKVQNAQGDLNMQRSILQQFIRSKVDLVVPIGTTATQMTISMVKEQPIVSLAANLDEQVVQNAGNITGVLDEIGPEKPLSFLKDLMPQLKKVTLIYSNSEKVFPEIEQALAHSNKIGIKIQKLMIQNLPELYSVSKLIDKDSEAIFILKDHLIVSGIQTLNNEAIKRNMIILSSDEGSVKEGATVALGVKESSIGEEGGIIASKILSGEKMNTFSIKKINKFVVFFNKKSCEARGVIQSTLESKAAKSGYDLINAEKE